MEKSKKEYSRVVLRVEAEIKAKIVERAHLLGIRPSAYMSMAMLVGERSLWAITTKAEQEGLIDLVVDDDLPLDLLSDE